MSNIPILTLSVALSIVRRLSGGEDYPFHVEGETRAAEVLITEAVSVEHAQAAIDEFDERPFPSVARLKAVCRELLDECQRCKVQKFRHQHKGCGTFVPPSDSDFKAWPEDEVKAKWQQTVSEGDRIMQEARAFWEQDRRRFAAVRQHLGTVDLSKATNLQIARAWRDLGFPLKPWMKDSLQRLGDSLQPQAVESPKPITHADIDREKQRVS